MINPTPIHLDFGNSRRVKVWLDDLPFHSGEALETRKFCCRSENGSGSRLEAGAVELYAPAGPMALYGLLGAEFVHDESGKLTVELRVPALGSHLYKEALRATPDDVYVGMPNEYAASVGEALEAFAAMGHLSISGKLAITCCAHSLTASSKFAFRIVASMLFLLFSVGDDNMGEDELRTVLSPSLLR